MLRAPGGQRGQPLRCSQQFGALPANEASPLVPCCLLMLQARRVRRQLHVPGVLICRLPPWAQRCPDARARADVLGRRADCTWSHTIQERGSGGVIQLPGNLCHRCRPSRPCCIVIHDIGRGFVGFSPLLPLMLDSSLKDNTRDGACCPRPSWLFGKLTAATVVMVRSGLLPYCKRSKPKEITSARSTSH